MVAGSTLILLADEESKKIKLEPVKAEASANIEYTDWDFPIITTPFEFPDELDMVALIALSAALKSHPNHLLVIAKIESYRQKSPEKLPNSRESYSTEYCTNSARSG